MEGQEHGSPSSIQDSTEHKNNHMRTNGRKEEMGEKIKRRYISNSEFKY